MNANGHDDSRAEGIEQIEDLPGDVDSQAAGKVTGGFNPQPDPPRIGVPIFRPPGLNPIPVVQS